MMFPRIGQCKPDFSGFAFNGFLVDYELKDPQFVRQSMALRH